MFGEDLMEYIYQTKLLSHMAKPINVEVVGCGYPPRFLQRTLINKQKSRRPVRRGTSLRQRGRNARRSERSGNRQLESEIGHQAAPFSPSENSTAAWRTSTHKTLKFFGRFFPKVSKKNPIEGNFSQTPRILIRVDRNKGDFRRKVVNHTCARSRNSSRIGKRR
jgi:hypothetical protein